jgi:hypothetical protein
MGHMQKGAMTVKRTTTRLWTLCVLCIMIVAQATDAVAVPLRVIEAVDLVCRKNEVSPSQSEITCRLRDTGGNPIFGARLQLVAAKTSRAGAAPADCSTSLPTDVQRTNRTGRVCFRVGKEFVADRVDLLSHDLYERTRVSVLEPAERAWELRLSPVSPVDIETRQDVSFAAVLFQDEDGVLEPVKRRILVAELDGKVLGEYVTDEKGRATPSLRPNTLTPGGHELRVHMKDASETSAKQTFVAYSNVSLVLASNDPGFDLSRRRLVFRATAGTMPSPPNGAVQVSHGGKEIAACALLAGRCALALPSFVGSDDPSGGAKSVRLEVRYVSGSPFYLAPPPVEVAMPVASALPSFLLPTVFVLIVCALGVLRFAKFVKSDSSAKAPTQGDAVPDVIWQPEQDHSGMGLTVRVYDAQENAAIRGACVSLVQTGFGREEVLFRSIVDDDGTAVIPVQDPAQKPLLRVEADGYRSFDVLLGAANKRGRAEGRGSLRIQLTKRKRALLRDFLRRFAKGSEPTPRTVLPRELAHELEHALFGPGAVNAELDQALLARIEQEANRTFADQKP